MLSPTPARIEGIRMHPINVLDAKNQLSRLLEKVESGAEREIVIARHGRPVARLLSLEEQPLERRIGVAKGRFEVPDDVDAHNDAVAAPIKQVVTAC